MADYIDREGLLNDIFNLNINDATKIFEQIAKLPSVDAVEVVRCKDCKHYYDDRQRIRERLNDAPTIDAVEQNHGYWILKPYGRYLRTMAFCSVCGKRSGIGGIVKNQKKPFCPNCGAVMDEVTEK